MDLPAVERANLHDGTTFERLFLPQPLAVLNEGYGISFHPGPDLSANDLDDCFCLIETTSKSDYAASSIGWKPRAKRREMRLPEMKYLLLRWLDELVAFASFMLTFEDGFEVVYCYEIHITAAQRGHGLGRMLMDIVHHVGERAGMSKAMLTVFASNRAALSFYKSLGYSLDASSPKPQVTRGGSKQSHYVILSRALS